MKLKNKTILITGGSGGIGKIIAKKLAKDGNKLILVARKKNELKKIVNKLGNNHQYIVCDLSKAKSINKLITKLSKTLNKLDILFNVAGIGIYKNLENLTDKEWTQSLATNVTAPYRLIKGLLPLLKKSSKPLVVNIGSGAGTTGIKDRSAYVASKFALRGLSLSLSKEYKDQNLSFVLFTLGSTLTGFGPLSLKEKIKLKKKGKAYFAPEWVVNKIIKITESKNPKKEYVLYPT